MDKIFFEEILRNIVFYIHLCQIDTLAKRYSTYTNRVYRQNPQLFQTMKNKVFAFLLLAAMTMGFASCTNSQQQIADNKEDKEQEHEAEKENKHYKQYPLLIMTSLSALEAIYNESDSKD